MVEKVSPQGGLELLTVEESPIYSWLIGTLSRRATLPFFFVLPLLGSFLKGKK